MYDVVNELDERNLDELLELGDKLKRDNSIFNRIIKSKNKSKFEIKSNIELDGMIE